MLIGHISTQSSFPYIHFTDSLQIELTPENIMTQPQSLHPEFAENSLDQKIEEPFSVIEDNGSGSLKSSQTLEQKQANFNLTIERIRQSTVSRQSGRTVSILSNPAQFRQFGPTAYLFFIFVKKCILFFTVLTVISLIPVLYNRFEGKIYAEGAKGFNVAFARTTLGAHSAESANQHQAKVVNMFAAALILSSFFLFWLYWKHYLSIQKIILKQQFPLASSNTVIVEDLSAQTTTEQLTTYLLKFGPIQQIVPVIDRGEGVRIAKEVYQLEQEIDQLEQLRQISTAPQQIQTAIDKNITSIKILKKQFLKQKSKMSNKTVRFYVKFQQQQIRELILNKFNKASCLCLHKQYPEQLLLNASQININRCEAQPSEIYWENQHVTFKQLVKPNLILQLLLNIISLLAIVLIAVVSTNSLPVYYNPAYASNTFTQQQIAAQKNTTVVASWCLSNTYSSDMADTCAVYTNLSQSRSNIYLSIAIIILLARLLTKFVILHMAKYLRFKNKVEFSTGIMFHLFINYTTISVLATLSVQTNLFGAAMGTIIASFISQPNFSQLQYYSDYTSQWYLDYGFQLALNLMLACFFPHILAPIFEYGIRKWKLRNIDKIQQQSALESYLSLPSFEIEDHYASCFMLIIVGMMFSGGSPIMILIILIGLTIKYLSAKFLFIYFNKIPDATGYYLVSKTPYLLLVAFAVYFVNGVWAYGVEDIFHPQTTLFSGSGIDASSNAKTVPEALLVFLRRLLNAWPLAVIFLLGIVVLSFRKKISNISHRILQKYVTHEAQTAKVEINLQNNNSEAHRSYSYYPQHQQKYSGVWLTLDRLLAE